jgi:tetratricopeptide (TPR) repeat protein
MVAMSSLMPTPVPKPARRARRVLHGLVVVLLFLAAGLLAAHGWAYWHFRSAERASARRDFAVALAHLDACRRVWFWDPTARALTVRAARRAGDLDRAEAMLRESRLDGELSDALSLESKLVTAQRGDVGRVENYLLGAVHAGHKDAALILEVLTPEYYRTFQLLKAQECVKRWVECEPDNTAAWLWRAQVCEKMRTRDEAIASYVRILELDPDNDDARLSLASHLSNSHQPQEALKQFEYLRARLGDTPAVRAGTARCLMELNRPDEARGLLDRLLAEYPHSGQFLSERGRLALAFESTAAAEPWFRRAAAAMPYEPDISYNLYQCLEKLGKHDEARAVLARMKAIEADLDRIKELTKSIARLPHDPELRREAGRILMRNGQVDEGVRWLESALDEDPNHGPTHGDLADYYAGIGNREKAEYHRRRAGR